MGWKSLAYRGGMGKSRPWNRWPEVSMGQRLGRLPGEKYRRCGNDERRQLQQRREPVRATSYGRQRGRVGLGLVRCGVLPELPGTGSTRTGKRTSAGTARRILEQCADLSTIGGPRRCCSDTAK